MRFFRLRKAQKCASSVALSRRAHTWSVRFAWSKWMACVLAREQGSPCLEERHILGGIYVACWETLISFWHVPSRFEELVAQECLIKRPRCAYHSSGRLNEAWEFTPQCVSIYNEAVEVAAGVSQGPEGSKIVLHPEDFLLALSRQENLDLSDKIRTSTLDLQKLEIAVRLQGQREVVSKTGIESE
jgi:hypothetical protein